MNTKFILSQKITRQIEPADFSEMKTEYSNKLEKLEAKLSTYCHDHVDIKDLLDKGIDNLIKLEHIYETSDIEKKREIISSMYPEKMTFDGFSFRTNRINEAVRLVYSMGEGYSENKNRTNGNNSNLSCQVGLDRQSSNLILGNLEQIQSLLKLIE